MISRNLLVRIAFALPAIALALAVLRAGGWVLAAVLGGLGVLGAREVYDMARRQGIAPLDGLGYVAAAACPFAAVWATCGLASARSSAITGMTSGTSALRR